MKVDPKKYKVKGLLKLLPEEYDDEEEEGDAVEVTVNILKVTDGKYCVEFIRNDGDQLIFF